MNLDWQSIRAINGSKRDGFEELVAQLAREKAPADAQFERVGAPDAGVECYCVFDNGSEWGWQTKYFTSSLTNSQWGQLDNSVKTALTKHPKLVRYFICIPWNKSHNPSPGQTTAKQKWEARVSKWQGWAQERGMNVEFVWWGESELLEQLSQPQQIGRWFFWFNERYFDRAWYENHLKEVVGAAGPRYTPQIHVDLPIARDLDLFGRTDAAVHSVKAIARDVRHDFQNISLSKEEAEKLRERVELSELLKSRVAILDAFSSISPGLIDEFPVVDIVERIEVALAESKKIEGLLEKFSLEHDSQQIATNDRSPYRTNLYRDVLHLVRRLKYRLREARNKLKHADEIANANVMILKGHAGVGKTHLLCDAASNRIKKDLPTILLMGQRFTDSAEPWTQALQHLDLPRDATSDQFVGALEAAGQAANRRALLIIDAINEGRGREIWPPHLSSFLSRIEKSPWIGTILSVRSSYEESVIPGNVRERAVNVTHMGFEGHQYDAVQKFSEHYKIEFPSTPILNPEFQNPLFLKIIFEGLKDAGEHILPRGFSGVTETFDIYLKAVNNRLAKTLDYNPNDNLVRCSLETVARRMLEIDPTTTRLPRQQTEKVVNQLLPGQGFSNSLYRGLIVEDVLDEDIAWLDGQSDEIVRFAYERFSDHIIVDFLIQKHLDPNNPNAAFVEGGGLAFISDKSIYTPEGILEAMCVQVPERTGQELIRLAPSLLDNAWYIGDAFLQSIVWRKPDAFTDDTLAVLNEFIQMGAVEDVVDTMLTVATIPGHYFNADTLDRILRSHAMPDRDAWWSIYLHHAWQNCEGPVHRLVDWASGITSSDDIVDEVVELAATTLAWMFSTPNRFLRDKSTKALVSLLTGRIDTAVRILHRFDSVDDPYIRERVYATAYGMAMRIQDAGEIEKLGRAVYENIFDSGKPPVHVLLRDYARGVVERALYLNKNMAIDEKLLRPPYGSDWPRIPDDTEIDRLTPHWNDKAGKWGTPEWARNRIRWSVTADDFSHYVIGTNLSTCSYRWMSLRIDEDMWQSPDERLQALLQNMNYYERMAWKKFKKSEEERGAGGITIEFVETKQRQKEEDSSIGLTFDEKNAPEIEIGRSKMLSAMTDPGRSELENIWQSQSEKFPGFDLREIQRYIVWRVFDLGWTVERLGAFDSISIGYKGRQANKAERMGKKYQWIAYHEILAYLADNYQYSPEYNDSGQVFQGTWQDSLRDIDPSCMLASKPGGMGFHGQSLSWWAQTAYEDWNEDISHQTWLDTDSDIPEIKELLQAVHSTEATKWLIVDGSFIWEQPNSASTERYDQPQRRIGIACQAYFIHATDVNEFSEWAKGVDFWGRWMPNAPECYSSDVFLGEYAWSPAFKYLTELFHSDDERHGWSNAGGKCPIRLLPASLHYVAESGSFDCSIDNGYSLCLPDATFTEKLELRWTGMGSDFKDNQGRIVAFDPTSHEDGANALLMRESDLKQFLAENDLALCWAVVGEKMVVGADDKDSESLKFRKLTGAYLLTDNGIEKIHQRSSYW